MTVVSSPWREAWSRFRRHRVAVASAGVFVAVAVICVFGPWIAALFGIDGTTINTDIGARPPTWSNWFGTDTLGRDLMVRVMIGGRVAITIALATTSIALVIGVLWGATAAYAGGRVDNAMMRVVDALYGLPTIAFIIVVMAVTGSRSLLMLFVLIGAISWLTMARIVRGQVLLVRNLEFVEAARALGAPPHRILIRHLVPNAIGPVIVYATTLFPQVMMLEAFLSFLGLGVQAPLASWGTLVTDGSSQIVVYPWLLVFPALVMAMTVMSLNIVGDGLRDALDPRSRR
ncbi:MAG: ABC transporter permease [Kofleriaceae bacterium]